MKLYNKNELKHSRIFFDKKPPIFMSIFSCFLILIMLLSIVGAKVISKPYIVRAQGVITTSDNQLVSAQTNGEIAIVYKKEGERVETGELLLLLSNGEEGLYQSAFEEQISDLTNKSEILARYRKSLDDYENLMKNEGAEQEYYGKVQYYLMQGDSDDFDMANISKEFVNAEEKQHKLRQEKEELDLELGEFRKQSTHDSIQRAQLEQNLESKKNELLAAAEQNLDEELRLQEEVDALNKVLEGYLLDVEIEEKILNLESQIVSKQDEIEAVDMDVNHFRRQLNAPVNQTKQLYAQFISEIGIAQKEIDIKVLELTNQIDIQTGQEGSLTVRAKNDGIVHYLMPVRVGESVAQGQNIAEISENENTDFQIEAYIEAYDISKVKIGNNVKIALLGVNDQKYGVLQGKLEKIDSGTLIQETSDGAKIFYKCLISLQTWKLEANDGTFIETIKSMPVEARIIYESETYYDWILKMLSFKN